MKKYILSLVLLLISFSLYSQNDVKKESLEKKIREVLDNRDSKQATKLINTSSTKQLLGEEKV